MGIVDLDKQRVIDRAIGEQIMGFIDEDVASVSLTITFRDPVKIRFMAQTDSQPLPILPDELYTLGYQLANMHREVESLIKEICYQVRQSEDGQWKMLVDYLE